MRIASLLPVAVTLGIAATSAACGAPDPQVCPSGWTADDHSQGGCRVDASTLETTRTRFNKGILGFARSETRECAVVGCGSDEIRLVSAYEVRIYAHDAAYPGGVKRTPEGDRVAPDEITIVPFVFAHIPQ